MVRTLLITGGTGELGHAVVARLARDYRCLVLYRNETSWQRLRDAVTGENVVGIAEAAQPSDEPLYGVVHLAGAFTMQSTLSDFEAMLDANLLSFVRAMERAKDNIVDGGRIVAISSAATLTHPGGMAAYVASKAALNATIEVLANELRPRGITANAILPTALDTPPLRKAMPHERLVPLGEVAETIAFLLGDAAATISGQLVAMAK
jgi:NAD(P)-dependent dehydrogenase (short-subunit alcohol dehydrogenase family)